MSSLNASFKIEPQSWHPSFSGHIALNFTSLNTKEIRLHVAEVKIKVEGQVNFYQRDFKINVHGNNFDKSYNIDLDPGETRSYSVIISCENTFVYEITAIDNEGCVVVAHGQRVGIPIEAMPRDTEKVVDMDHITLDRIVRFHPRHGSGTYIITNENGTPNDFGIFDRHNINPTAAYIDMGRQGYMSLIGRCSACLEWDRDTVASPPEDLHAVHITDANDKNRHGWVFKNVLLFDCA